MLIKIRIVTTGWLLLFLIFLLFSCVSNHNSKVYYDYDHGYHTVLKGETLYSIAFRHGMDYKKIARWNNIRPPYTIYAGQRLKLSSTQVTSKSYQTKKKSTSSTAKNKRSTSKNIVNKPAVKIVSKPIKHDWNWPTKGVVIRAYSPRTGGNKGIDISGKIGQPVLSCIIWQSGLQW